MEHQADSENVHHDWDNSLEPTLRIESGDTVAFDLKMAGDGQIELGDAYENTSLDFATFYHLVGPVHVEGAEPGDTLRVEVLELKPGAWGWSAVLADDGLLPDEFPDSVVWTFDLSGDGPVEIVSGVKIPRQPFLGTMGTHPDFPKTGAAFPPHKGGGNMDNRHLGVGTTLWLPIWCEGALFSCGDPHAAQGDGEVCVTALECPMNARLKLTVEKRSISVPTFQTAGPLTLAVEGAGHRGTMGISPDLMEGARKAVSSAIEWITAGYGLSREDAYLVCSLAGDLKIHEVVDSGVWNVGFTVPLSIFE